MTRAFQGFAFPPGLDETARRFRTEGDYSRHVRSLIRQVLLTTPGERIDRPDFGAGLRQQLFEPTGESPIALLETRIFQSLERWLGDLIRVDSVTTSFDEGRLDVALKFTLKARGQTEVLNLVVTS